MSLASNTRYKTYDLNSCWARDSTLGLSETPLLCVCVWTEDSVNTHFPFQTHTQIILEQREGYEDEEEADWEWWRILIGWLIDDESGSVKAM